MDPRKEQLILDLHAVGALKFGEFTLKSGATSPFYIDLRGIVSHPGIMRAIVDLIKPVLEGLSYDVLTGIPYTALPLAAQLSIDLDKPLVYQRKEAKAYGTGKRIEGEFTRGQTCLVIDDLITTGESKFEAAEALEDAGLKVRDFVIVVDRSPTGGSDLAKKGFRLHSIITIEDMLLVLGENGFLDERLQEAIRSFVSRPALPTFPPFEERCTRTTDTLSGQVLERIREKRTNLVLSLDESEPLRSLEILEASASEILMVKTHVDILNGFTPSWLAKVRELAEHHGFYIFEDRKFADIGSTVRKQFREGLYRIADWADFVTVHMIAGEAILDGLFQDLPRNVGAFLLARMSASGNLISETYTRQVLEVGKRRLSQVAGFIGYGSTSEEIRRLRQKIGPDQLLFMPGVNLDIQGDQLGQRYVSARDAMLGGVDAVIVGRGIYGAEDPGAQAARYRRIAWEAFQAAQK